jgi:heavy metal efflux system protein
MGRGDERPIAVVIMGGTISAAILTLFVLPAMYKLLAPILQRAEELDDGPASVR